MKKEETEKSLVIYGFILELLI